MLLLISYNIYQLLQINIKCKGETMSQAIIHGILLAFGLILPLGAQNVFVFNQGANHKSLKKALSLIITASLCDTFLNLLAVLGVTIFLNTFPTLKLIIYFIGLLFLLYMAYSIWNKKQQIKINQMQCHRKSKLDLQ